MLYMILVEVRMIDMRQRHTTVGHIFGANFGTHAFVIYDRQRDMTRHTRVEVIGVLPHLTGPRWGRTRREGESGERQESRARRKGEQQKVGGRGERREGRKGWREGRKEEKGRKTIILPERSN